MSVSMYVSVYVSILCISRVCALSTKGEMIIKQFAAGSTVSQFSSVSSVFSYRYLFEILLTFLALAEMSCSGNKSCREEPIE